MNKLTNPKNRFAAITILCCIVLLLSAFTLPTKQTNHPQLLSSSLISVHVVKTNGHVHPLSMYMTSSPISQTARVDTTINITFSWGGGGVGTTVFIVDWRDGSSDSYRCGFNCISGSFTYSHVYTRIATFVAKGYLDSNPAIATWSTVYSIS